MEYHFYTKKWGILFAPIAQKTLPGLNTPAEYEAKDGLSLFLP